MYALGREQLCKDCLFEKLSDNLFGDLYDIEGNWLTEAEVLGFTEITDLY